jgi:alkylation response protein AidB-like acyl-CoA dehydrogenase
MTKTPLLATSTLATQHTTHERVGRAEALLRAGRAFLYETVRELPYGPTWSAELSDDLRARIRLAGAHAAQNAAEAVDLMFNAAGTTSIYASSRLERCFRDVHVATQHIAVAPSNIEMVGQYFLGLGLQVRR